MSQPPPGPRKGRGAAYNPDNRYAPTRGVAEDDGWPGDDAALPPLTTTVTVQDARSALRRNQSPDVPFRQSVNPYQGCEHGCVYCFARPTHAYLELSPGLDFETRLFAKGNAAALLRQELSKPGYRPEVIALGSNTDPWQPIERDLKITRQILELLTECRHPVGIVTKSFNIVRDLDLLTELARNRLVQVMISVTTLDHELARQMEPRASSPARRLEAIARLAQAGVPVGVLAAPMIPALNDGELETILAASAEQGATRAGYVLLRLPLEIKPLFETWLADHYPLKARHVMSLAEQMHGGKAYDSAFGTRMRGSGQFAELLAQRFHLACRRLGLTHDIRNEDLRTDLFQPPARDGQMALF